MSEQGWIKLHRKILYSSTFDNPKLFKTWIWCLCKATHTEHELLVGRQLVKLKPGQFVFGRLKAAEELKLNDRTVYDYMKLLEKMKNITIKSNNKFSIVTVENWEFYQGKQEELQHQMQQETTIKSTIEMNTNNNGKNVSKNGREDGVLSPHDKGWIDWAWNIIKSEYPRPERVELGKPYFLELVGQVPIEDRNRLASNLLTAIRLYTKDHEEANPDDVGEYRFALRFDNWFKEKAAGLMQEVEELRKKRAEE